MKDQIDEAIKNSEPEIAQENSQENESEEPNDRPKEIILTFHSNGSIDFAANKIGMMDLWAASKLLDIKGQEVYVTGMNEMRRQMEEQAKNDPRSKILIAQAPLPRTEHGSNN